MTRACIPLALGAALAITVSGPAKSATVDLAGTSLFPVNRCTSTDTPSASCVLEGFEELGPDDFLRGYGVITAIDSSDRATITAATFFGSGMGGESASGAAQLSGTRTFRGRTGNGFAEFSFAWALDIYNAYGCAGYARPGLTYRQCGVVRGETGTAWSEPIPMVWGDPFTYDLQLSGGFANGPGDCCGGMDLSVSLVGWRVFDSGMQPVHMPEPATRMLLPAILIGFAICALPHRKRSRPFFYVRS